MAKKKKISILESILGVDATPTGAKYVPKNKRPKSKASEKEKNRRENLTKGTKPKIVIDWELVDYLCEAGCSGQEISARIGICDTTLYERVRDRRGVNWSTYKAMKLASGDACIRETQYRLAMEGDRSLLMFLGKCRLGQNEWHQNNPKNSEADVRKLLNLIESRDDGTISQDP